MRNRILWLARWSVAGALLGAATARLLAQVSTPPPSTPGTSSVTVSTVQATFAVVGAPTFTLADGTTWTITAVVAKPKGN